MALSFNNTPNKGYYICIYVFYQASCQIDQSVTMDIKYVKL